MKIFPSSSIKKLDAYTIENEPIASIDLMERAATVLTKAITDRTEEIPANKRGTRTRTHDRTRIRRAHQRTTQPPHL